ncbi:MAG: DUF6603 domain-containing protein [Candidatus Binatia bacterium]
MAEAPIKTDLILRGRIARQSVTFVGRLEDGALAEVSGSVSLNASLSSLFDDLGVNYGEAATVLKQLVGSGDIVLEKLGAAYRRAPKPTKGGSVQVGLIIKLGDNSVQFALLKGVGDQKGFIAGVDLRAHMAVPKNFLSGIIGDISIGNLGVYYASEEFKDVAFVGADAFQDATQFTLEPARITPPRTFSRGVKFSADILVGGVNLLDQLAIQKAETTAREEQQTPNAKDEAGKAEEILSKGSTFWIEAKKAIGPLSIRRIGLSYEAPLIGIKFDAGLQLSVLSLSLEGLGLSYPIDKFSMKPGEIWENLKFHLDGASVTFSAGPLTIGGGLLKVEDPKYPNRLQLDGFLLIRTEIFTINAIGSYADMDGTPSLFVFAALQKELGGPAFFFVTGLSVGFGINRALKLPAINEVHNFPLVKAATDPDYLGKNLDLRDISRKLGAYIYPLQGNFWIAAGVKFNSFGQIDSFAMLSVSFGTQFEIALLGMSRIRVPKLLPGMSEDTVPAIACAELAFKVAFTPANGVLSFEARLTENSFVLRKDFRLRGGFAFYSWFAGEHEGDFVVSIGGYHPKFKPPAHYPKPDLVEFACKIGDAVAIRGYCYFALCPSAIMAGGGLSVVYQLGGLRAWFIAQADFLIQWKPLYYDIAISVSIGVALRLDVGALRICLSVELSAAVQLHGPPLGGIARVSLYIVTVEIAFGEAKRIPPPLLWESVDSEKSFAKAFLPNPKVTTITITDGLLKETKIGETTVSSVSPQKLLFSARTLTPATHVEFNQREIPLRETDSSEPRWTTELGVRPMGKERMYSLITITFEPNGGASQEAKDYLQQYLDVSIVTKSVPRALWDKPVLEKDKNKPPQADQQMIDNALVGLEIKTKAGPRPWETPVLDLDVLAYDRETTPFDWPTPKPTDSLPGFDNKTIANTIAAPNVVKLRSGILAELARTNRKIMKPEDIHLEQLSQNAQYIFQDMPVMARVGQYPPRGYLETISG